MKAVGVKVLKAKLSEYLRIVKTGVTVLVTERDEVIAEIHPARRQKVGELTLEERLVAMAERGEATLASRPVRRDWSSFLKGVTPARGFDLQETLDELREDAKFRNSLVNPLYLESSALLRLVLNQDGAAEVASAEILTYDDRLRTAL